jgi:hypothetical protein
VIGVGLAEEWIRFLDARGPEDAVSELRRAISRLDDSSDEVTGVLTHLSGSPSADVEEVLRVSRTATHEAIGLLNVAITRIRLGDPDAA